MKKINLGMIGGGIGAFIGDAHRRASRICNDYTLVGGLFSASHEKSLKFAKEEGLDLERCYATIDALIKGELKLPEGERMQAVSIVTPNYIHFEHAKKLIENGFHVICDKPLTTSVEDAEYLQHLLKERELVFCLTHTYTGYPMVRQMRSLIQQGVLGKIQRIDAQYYQGWVNAIIHNKGATLNTWRLDPKISGISSCMADIGVHAFNLIEYTTGEKIKKILADLNSLKEDNPMDLDGTVLLRFDGNFKGVIRASQIATGEENNIRIAVYGSKGGLKWEQEDPNYLYLINDDEPVKVYKPGHEYNSGFALASHVLPPGHPEGIYEAFGNLYKGAAKAIRGLKVDAGEFPGIEDGVRGMKFIEAAVKSNKEGNIWVEI